MSLLWPARSMSAVPLVGGGLPSPLPSPTPTMFAIPFFFGILFFFRDFSVLLNIFSLFSSSAFSSNMNTPKGPSSLFPVQDSSRIQEKSHLLTACPHLVGGGRLQPLPHQHQQRFVPGCGGGPSQHFVDVFQEVQYAISLDIHPTLKNVYPVQTGTFPA